MLAPVLLVALRLIQGFAVAGEISGASSMIVEHAPFGRRGSYASFTLQGVQAGQILAAAVFLPLAHYIAHDAFNRLGLADSVSAQLHRHHRGYIIRREVDGNPRFAGRKRSTARCRNRRSPRPSSRAGRTCCGSSAWR